MTHCRVISTIDNRLRSIYSRNCALKFYKYANGKPWYGNKTWGYISLTLSRGRWRAEMPNRHCSPTPDPRDGGSRPLITPVSAALFADRPSRHAPRRTVFRCVPTAVVPVSLGFLDSCLGKRNCQWWSGFWGRLPPSRGSERCYRAYRVLRAPPPSTKMEAWERLFPALVSRILPRFFGTRSKSWIFTLNTATKAEN